MLSTELIRYLSALQIKLLNIFNQIENIKLLLINNETTKRHRLLSKTAKKHSFQNNEHKIVCSQSDL